MTRNYTDQEIIGYLLWCVGLLMDDVQRVVETHPNNKPLSTLTKEEFAVENADMGLAAVAGQLGEMGIDCEKLVEISNGRSLPEITEFRKLSRKI